MFAGFYNVLSMDALVAWSSALVAIRMRERETASMHLAVAYNSLSGIRIRFTKDSDVKMMQELCSAQHALDSLHSGCIGKGGLSDIDKFISAAEACALLPWWSRPPMQRTDFGQ